MKNTLSFIIGIFLLNLMLSCKLYEEEPKPKEVYGCMDSTATNYNPEATIDDESCGYCKEGTSFLLISTDGGNTWEFNCPQDIDLGSAFQISVVDSNNIWIATGKSVNDSYNEYVMYSADMGKTWKEQYTVPQQEGGAGLDQIKFVDENNGLIVVDEPNVGPIFYSTNNGGNSWTQVQTPPTVGSLRNNRRVDFIDMNTVFFLNTNIAPRVLFGTDNLGAPWDTTHFSEAFMLKFYDENIGIVTDHRNAYRTIDGRETWQSFPLNFVSDSNIFWGYNIKFSNNSPKDVWLLDRQYIHFSSDTGRTWINYPYDNDYAYDMHIHDNKAWIVGGYTLRYSNSATEGIWTDISLPTQPLPIKMFPEAIGGCKDEVIVTTGSF
jgi:photosystem II stability/assembly factor-like uncharacterized protein